jgi:hypothetical protein
MQPLYEDKWTSTLNKEVPNNLSIKLEDDFDVRLVHVYRDIFNKSIEKLKDVNTMKLYCTTLLGFLYKATTLKWKA